MAVGLALLAGLVSLAGSSDAQGMTERAGRQHAALAREVAAALDASGVPGAAVALVDRDGTTWSAGFGLADVEAGTPVTPTTLFRAQSVSKTVTALAVLRLVEAGRLGLDDRLRDVAPGLDFDNPWETTHPVRVVHLLEHTTGFDDLHLREYAFTRADGTLAQALAVNPAPRAARWAPGTAMAYNNGAYAVAGMLVEQAAGQPFETAVGAAVLGPLGMTASGFDADRVDRARLARGYVAGAPEDPSPQPLLTVPAGGLVTSVDDLALLVHALLRGGAPIVGPASVARMERPRTTDAARAGLRAGYGLGSYTSTASGRVWHGHAGGTPAWTARYAYQPALGVGYVVLMNGSDADARRRVEVALQRALVAGRPAPAPPPVDQAGSVLLGAYEGLYRQRTSTWKLAAGIERLLDVQRVRVGAGGLTVAPALFGDAPDTLLAANGDLFRSLDDAEPSAVFLRDAGGGAAGGQVTGLRTWDAANLRAGTYEPVSALRAYGLPIALGLSILVALSALVVGLARGALALAGRRARDGAGWARWLPVAAVLALVGAVVSLAAGLGGDPTVTLGRPGGAAVGFWAATWAFAVLAVAALGVSGHALVRRPGLGRTLRAHSFAVALACAVLAVTLASWGWVGLRTWAF